MKKLIIVLMVLSLMGCMTERQMKAEANYYTMLTNIAKAQQAQPLVKITPAKEGEPMVFNNVKSIEVFAPPPALSDFARQYAHRDFTPAWVAPAIGLAAPFATLYGSALLIKEVQGIAGTTYNQTINGNNNATRLTGQAFSNASVNGNSNVVGGMVDQTSTPTVVNQPAPVIVQPQVVTIPTQVIEK